MPESHAPEAARERPDPVPKRRSYSGLWMRRVLIVALVLAPMAWLWKAIEGAREAARFTQCYGDYKGIALALHNYHQQHGSLPPACLTDAKGRPTLSWRVLILPFMEEDTLYTSFDLTEPWDGPNNIKLMAKMPRIYGCPNQPDRNRAGLTRCVAISGPGTFFPGATPTRFADATDGVNQTIMLAETGNLDVPWTAPVDLDIRKMSLRINDPSAPGISGPHPQGQTICTADGAVRQISPSILPRTLHALLTIAGGEAVDLEGEIVDRRW
jgi:hypothetical protein